jgi:hypothetical protein
MVGARALMTDTVWINRYSRKDAAWPAKSFAVKFVAILEPPEGRGCMPRCGIQ